MHMLETRLTLARALANTGQSTAAKIAMIAITTSSSMGVKPLSRARADIATNSCSGRAC